MYIYKTEQCNGPVIHSAVSALNNEKTFQFNLFSLGLLALHTVEGADIRVKDEFPYDKRP